MLFPAVTLAGETMTATEKVLVQTKGWPATTSVSVQAFVLPVWAYAELASAKNKKQRERERENFSHLFSSLIGLPSSPPLGGPFPQLRPTDSDGCERIPRRTYQAKYLGWYLQEEKENPAAKAARF